MSADRFAAQTVDETIEITNKWLKQFTEHGGLAFPTAIMTGPNGQTVSHTGMSLRDYFAAKAMQGMIGVCLQSANQLNKSGEDLAVILGPAAYRIADFMLTERAK